MSPIDSGGKIMNYRLLSIPLSEDEQKALQVVASQQCRRPRDQARFLLLAGLGMTDKASNDLSTNSKSDAIHQDTVAFAA
jgi:hypothetical protein